MAAPFSLFPAIATAEPEMQLLCCCVRDPIDNSTIEAIRTLSQQAIDWALLLRKAHAHGVIPLLHKNSYLFAAHVPPHLSNKLKTQFHLNALRNQYFSQELIRVLTLLEASHIAAVPFKGPSLAVLAYENLGLRQFGDLDILVQAQDFLAAKDLLLAEGYERAQRLHGIADIETQETALVKKWGEYPLIHPQKKVSIDLHSRLIAGEFPVLSARFDSFWKQLISIPLLNTQVKTFCPEDLLLYLCIHGSKDFWQRLGWVCDVAALIHRYPQLNWAEIEERAQRLNCEQMLWLGVSLAQDLLHSSIPAAVERMQHRFQKRSLSTQIQTQLLSDTRFKDLPYKKLRQFKFHGQLIDNKNDRRRYYISCANRLLLGPLQPNIKDLECLPLPRRLHFLYYTVRPIRLLIKWLS